MSHDGRPQPYVLGDLVGFRISRIFQVFRAQHGVPVLPGLSGEQFSSFWRFEYGDLVGDLKGDPILIPCLASEAEAGIIPRSQGLR